MGTYTDDEWYRDLAYADVEAAPEHERLRIIDKMLHDHPTPVPSLTKAGKLYLYNKLKPAAIQQHAEHLKRCLRQKNQRFIDPADAFGCAMQELVETERCERWHCCINARSHNA